MHISIGCGKTPKPGFIGLDNQDFKWNKIWDATRDNLPFADSESEFIEMHNFLEHIERKHWIRLFNECHRVLKRNGVLEIIVPNAGKDLHIALADPTHVSLFVPGTLKYLTGQKPRNANYGILPWKIISEDTAPTDIRVSLIRLSPNK